MTGRVNGANLPATPGCTTDSWLNCGGRHGPCVSVAVIDALRDHADSCDAARVELAYFVAIRERMRYPAFRAQDLSVTTGVVEGRLQVRRDALRERDQWRAAHEAALSRIAELEARLRG